MESNRTRWERFGWVAETVAAFVLLQGMGSAQTPSAAASGNSQERLLLQNHDTLPFTLVDGYLIVVEGGIGAHRHLKLVLDTGSTHSVLRSDLAEAQTFVRRPVR